MRPSAVLSALALSTSLVAAQNKQNTINFSTIEIFNDLKRCLKAVFIYDYGINNGPVQKQIGCETNDCICRADTLQDAISTAGLLAQSACSNSGDRLTATSILSQYCIDKGITAGAPAPTNNAGAPVTVFATTTVALTTVTATVTVSSASELYPIVGVRNRSTPVSAPSTPTPVTETRDVVSTISGSLTTIYSTITTIPGQTSIPQSSNNGSSGNSNIGAIAGGVVGGLVVLGAILGFFIWFMRRKRNNSYSATEQGAPPSYEKDLQLNQLGGMDMDTQYVASGPANRTEADPTINTVVPPNSRYISPNGLRMSIEYLRSDPTACLLLLPFLLPSRTRVFLRGLLRNNTLQNQSLSSRTVERQLWTVSKSSPYLGTASSDSGRRKRGSSIQQRREHGLKKLPQIFARQYSERGGWRSVRSSSNKKSDSKAKEQPADGFSMLENAVKARSHRTNIIKRKKQQDAVFHQMADDNDKYYAGREKMEEEIEQIRDNLEKFWNVRPGRYNRSEDNEDFFWLLEQKYPIGSPSTPQQLFDLPGVKAAFPPRQPPNGSTTKGDEPAGGQDEVKKSNIQPVPDGAPDEFQTKSGSVSFRMNSLDEFVVFAPPFSSQAEKEDYYALYLDKFLPPHLQGENTHPSPPVKSNSTPSLATDLVDSTYPSVFGSLGESSAPIHQREDNLESILQDLEVEWDARWTQTSFNRLLYTLEIAREDGVDVLNSLLLKRRQREVIWIAKKIVDTMPGIANLNLNVWRLVNAVGDQDNPKKPGIDNTLQDGMVMYTREELADIARRRRGVGVLLSSLTSMLLSGWRAEKAKADNTAFNAITMIDTPPILDLLDGPSSHSSLLVSPLGGILNEVPEGDEMQMTAQELFSTVAQLLAYLHVENHVPPIVYSEKHPRLHAKQAEIIQLMTAEIEAAYGRELGLNIPQPNRVEERVDWSLWIELVNCIAAERGLGVSATWLLLQHRDEISWEGASPRGPSNDVKNPDLTQMSFEIPPEISTTKKLVLPSYLIPQATSTCLHNAALDAWPPETPGRMIRLLTKVAENTGPFDVTFARALLDHPEVNIFASYAEDILKIPIDGKWTLDIHYQILMGACIRRDLSRTIKAWADIENCMHGSSPILELQVDSNTELPAVEFAPYGTFAHPLYVIIAMISHCRSRRKFGLLRYILKTAVQEEHIRNNGSLLNLMFQHAGDTKDFAFAKYCLGFLAPPLAHRTITSVLNMHLSLGQQKEAQAILDFMKRSGIEPDHVDLGIVARNTFKQSHEEGYALMDRAVSRADEYKKKVLATVTTEKPFRDGVFLPVKHKLSDPIGSAAWFATLVAAVRGNNKEKASEALKALGIDFADPRAASKMGVRVFNTLLTGVCRREGSVQGMRMFKLYCLPNKQLLKMMDESIKSHRSGDRRIDDEQDQVGSRVGPGIMENRGPQWDSNNPNVEEKKKELEGVVVPDIITIRIIVHQALREKRDYYTTKKILENLPMSDSDRAWMRNDAYFETNWSHVINWAKGVWSLMQYGRHEWQDMMQAKILGKRSQVHDGGLRERELLEMLAKQAAENESMKTTNTGIVDESEGKNSEDDNDDDLLRDYDLPPELTMDDWEKPKRSR
ncbi:hypothetical protein TWF703_010171 [Orbilia oligospora]|uniref:Pentatricopeptide repeat protein n=2 Tax=Orbilia oligospora TaxID=2813651 RepID=A0A7C8JSI9_ORBOL|nr:hypothetical protein TWF703_010171 [Orbilia oligospora]